MSVLINKTHASFLKAVLKNHIKRILVPSINELEHLDNNLLSSSLLVHTKNSIKSIEQLCHKLAGYKLNPEPLLLHPNQKKLLAAAYQGYVDRCSTRSKYLASVISEINIDSNVVYAKPHYQEMMEEILK